MKGKKKSKLMGKNMLSDDGKKISFEIIIGGTKRVLYLRIPVHKLESLDLRPGYKVKVTLEVLDRDLSDPTESNRMWTESSIPKDPDCLSWFEYKEEWIADMKNKQKQII